MTIRGGISYIGKLLLGTLVYVVGLMLGGALASALQLPVPGVSGGMDASSAFLIVVLRTPLLMLALALLARYMAGGFLARTLGLALLMWIATLNTQIEATVFTTLQIGMAFTLVQFAVPDLLGAAAIAWLFPPPEPREGFSDAARAFFARRAPASWAWRLAAAAVAFMPIYWIFGLLVIPFTLEYYQQSMFGLKVPVLDLLLTVLFTRSVLFFAACLPFLILWRGSFWSLSLRLGFALFLTVGLLDMLVATWMPLSVRVPHTLEIMADEFVYAWALCVLLFRSVAPVRQEQPAPKPRAPAPA